MNALFKLVLKGSVVSALALATAAVGCAIRKTTRPARLAAATKPARRTTLVARATPALALVVSRPRPAAVEPVVQPKVAQAAAVALTVAPTSFSAKAATAQAAQAARATAPQSPSSATA
jgi:hypothetical protein